MPGFQKTLDVQPTIASLGNPPQTGGEVANAVQAVGGAVKSFVVGKKKDQLEEELSTLGDEVFAAQIGRDAKEVTQRFEKLRKAKEQGVLSQTMVNIETEKVLKEAIGKTPGIAPEIRQYAAQLLGFDPTGTYLRDLLGVADPTTDNSIEKKAIEEAQFISKYSGANFDDIMVLQANDAQARIQTSYLSSIASIGGVKRREIYNSVLNEGKGRMAEAVGEILKQIKGGGVTNPNELASLMTTFAISHKNDLTAQYEAAGLTPDAAELSRELDGIDAFWADGIKLTKSGAMSTILEDQAKSLTHAMAIQSKNLFGHLALLNESGGQEAVKQYFLIRDKFQKPEQLALLKSIDPQLAYIADNEQVLSDAVADAFMRVTGRTPLFKSLSGGSEPTETDNALGDVVAAEVAKTKSSDESVIPYLQQRGKYKGVSILGQQGVRQRATGDEIKWMQKNFETEYQPLLANIAAGIAADPRLSEIHIEVNRKGELSFNRPKVPVGVGELRPTAYITPSMEGDLKRLNAWNKAIQNGWGGDLNKDKNSFINETVSSINNLIRQGATDRAAINEAIDAFNTNPTKENLDALRKLDPDLVSESERIAGHVSGGSPSAK